MKICNNYCIAIKKYTDMNNVEFEKKLKLAGLTKIKFSELTKMNRGSVSNWQQEGKTVPSWVDSWLENYIHSQAFEKIREAVLEVDPNKKTNE